MWLEYLIVAVALVVAYLLGSIPTGYLVGKWSGIDIREHGSGSTGATNVWRVLGKTKGIAVFVVDFSKGIGAIALWQWLAQFTPYFQPWQDWLTVGIAFLAIVGHSLPVWINWRGGKSVATGLGILFWLNWQTALVALGIWLGIMAVTRTVSLSSIVGAVSAPICLVLFHAPLAYQLLAGIASIYILWTHRSNIQRLRKGEEYSFHPKPESPN
ncbi:MAG: glycerol-3-phosphate 1-O-acyltransferase PlsY [Pseudanabaenaceae cyanobacterium]